MSPAILLLTVLPPDEVAVAILHRTALTYEAAGSFEVTASLSVKVPGQDLIITTGQTAIHASGAMLPPDAPIPLLEFGTLGGKFAMRNSAGQEVKASLGGFSIQGFPFSSLDVLDKRLISANVLPEETLAIGGESKECHVVEALYESRTPFDGRSGRPVRLWIDKWTALLVQATYARGWKDGELAQWSARVERITLGQPPPAWAIEKSAAMMAGRKEAKWEGQALPEFKMQSLDGRVVSLAGLRGKVVLLNFWATWCGPCREEMPLLEKLREEMAPRGVEIWGVTDEAPDVARRWLADRKRTLPTLVDTDRVLFRHFDIESIPVLITVRGDGAVSSFVVGLRGERDLRADLERARQ